MTRPYHIRAARRLAPLCAALLIPALAACATSKQAEAPPAPPSGPTVVQTDILLTPQDEAELKIAMEQLALVQPNRAIPWSSAESGLVGAVKVLRDGFDTGNRPCREFHSVITQGNLYKHMIGFLCQHPTGTWEVVDVRNYPLYRHGDA